METENTPVVESPESSVISEPAEIPEEKPEETLEEGVEATPEETPEEAEVEPPAPLPKKKDELSSKFAALSRKERQIREREKELQNLQRQLEEQKTSRQTEDEKTQQDLEFSRKMRELAQDKTKRHVLLKELENTLGVGYNELTEAVLEGGEPNPDKIVEQVRAEYKSEIQKLQEKLDSMEQARQQEREEAERQAKEQEDAAAVEDFMNGIKSFVNERPDDYKMIRYEDATDLVYETIATYYEENGRMLSNEDAANHVEEYLRGEAEKRAKALGFKPEVSEPPKEPAPRNPASPTLSNEQSTQSPPSDIVSNKSLDEIESLDRAAKLLKFND